MTEYTFECKECKTVITFTEHRETPTHELHFSQDVESGELLLACDGELHRVWQPTPFVMKGKGYKNNSIYKGD